MGHAIPEVSAQDFPQQVLQAGLPVLVDFGADWCPPCRMLDPIVADLAQRYQGRMQVVGIDADEAPELTYQYGVMGLPTLILFQNGTEVERITGYQPRERIESKLAPFLLPANV